MRHNPQTVFRYKVQMLRTHLRIGSLDARRALHGSQRIGGSESMQRKTDGRRACLCFLRVITRRAWLYDARAFGVTNTNTRKTDDRRFELSTNGIGQLFYSGENKNAHVTVDLTLNIVATH